MTVSIPLVLEKLLEQLDSEECYSENAPENITQPGRGGIIFDPYISVYDRDCSINGIETYPDSDVLYVTNDGTSDYISLCDNSGNTSGCSQLRSTLTDQLVIFGNPPTQNLTVFLSPNSSTITHYAFTVQTQDAYVANISLPPENWADYNITSLQQGNCTDTTPFPWPDPIPPGIACDFVGDAYFRRLENVTYDLGPVYLWHDDNLNGNVDVGAETTLLTCTVDTIPGYTCVSTSPHYNGIVMGVGDNNTFYTLSELGSTCADSAHLPPRVLCRYGMLFWEPAAPSEYAMIPVSVSTDHYLRIPCTFESPPQYSCTVNGTGPAVAYNGTSLLPLVYAVNYSLTNMSYVPCIQNQIAAVPPCVQVNASYTDGSTVRLEFEGTATRFYVNETRRNISCAVTSTLSAGIMGIVQDYSGVSVTETQLVSFDSMVDAAAIRVQEELMVHSTVLNTTGLFRKQNFVCCLSEFLKDFFDFVIAFAAEWVYTIRALLTLPANIPGFKFPVPTFATALDKLRNSACSLACTVTSIFGDLWLCGSISTTIGCQSGSTCASSLLCHVIDILLLLASIVVEFLTSVRDIVNGTPSQSVMLGSECSSTNVADCVSSFLIYIITKITFTVTQAIRDLASNLDCLLCAITTALKISGTACAAAFYTFIDTLCDLIDNMVKGVLGTLVKIVVAIVAAFVYLFGGDIGKFFDELGNIILLLGQLFENFALLVAEFLAKLLGFSIPTSKKRKRSLADLQSTGWIPPQPANVTNYWNANHSTCRDFIPVMNNTASPTETNETDVDICISGVYWATLPLTIQSGPCDQRFAEFFTKNMLWSRLGASDRQFLYTCQVHRTRLLRIGETFDFVPPDLLDDWRNVPNFVEATLHGMHVYTQYRLDRTLPTPTVMSPEYQSNYQASGMSVVHLESMSSLTPTQVHDALMVDDPTYGLTMTDYAQRTIELESPSFIWPPHTVDATTRIMTFWDSFYGSPRTQQSSKRDTSSSSSSGSLLSQFADFFINRTVQQQILPVPPLNWSAMGDVTNPASGQFLHLGTQALILDLPLHVVKALDRARQTGLFSKGVVAGQSLVQTGYAAILAVASVTRDLVTGTRTPMTTALISTVASTIWKPRPENETLGAVVTRLVASVSDVATRTMGVEGPAKLYQTYLNLVERADVARYRRNKMTRLVQLVSSSFVRQFVSEDKYEEMGVIPVLQPAIDVSSLSCLSPYPELCANCLYLDQLVGHVIGGTTQSLSYYSANGTQEPSFNYSFTQYQNLAWYFGNTTAAVEIGDATYLPIRWPWYGVVSPSYSSPHVISHNRHNYSNWRIVGDPTPNKIRFTDLADQFQELLDFILGPAEGSGGGGGGGVFSLARSVHGAAYSLVTSPRWSGINAIFASIVKDVIGAPTLRAASTNAIRITATSVFTMLSNLITYIKSWIKSCSYRAELNGSAKRFSIGESVLMMSGIAAGLGLFLGALLPGQILTVLGGVGVLLSGTILFGTVVVSHSWSYTCAPALPMQLADDLIYFATHSLFPRCDPYFAGIILNETFTNDQCAICANYETYEYADPYNGVGFTDFGYNAAFTLKTMWPAAIEWLNTTRVPILSDLVALDFVQTRLNAFSAYDPTDAISYSVYQSSNYVWTFVPNLTILVAVAYLLSRLWPFVGLIANFLTGLILPTYFAALVSFESFRFVMLFAVLIAHAEKDAIADPEHLAYDDAVEPRNTVVTKMKALRRRFQKRPVLRV